jgi:transcriptional regulator with XRE-family HTH domain
MAMIRVMDRKTSARRATAAQRTGRSRATAVARRVGTGLREARLAAGLRQRDVAERAGVSQSYLSDLERGHETGASLEALASVAAALGAQLAAFVEAQPGAQAPRDLEHLRRQAMLIDLAGRGGWRSSPEHAVAHMPHPRSVDVLLTRAARREAVVSEVWDWLPDGGEAIRGLDLKTLAVRDRLGAGWRVQGLLLLRRTSRNRALVRAIAPLIEARYPASSASWLRALTDPGAAMPNADGFVWTSVDGTRLIAARFR